MQFACPMTPRFVALAMEKKKSHCGRSRQVRLQLLPYPCPPFLSPSFTSPQARLVIVAGPAPYPSYPPLLPILLQVIPQPRPGLSLWQVPPCPSPLSSYLASIYYSLSEALLVNVAGLASPLLSLSYSLSISCCHPARAGRHGRSKVILLTLCHHDPQVMLMATRSTRTTSFFHWRVWLRFILQITDYIGFHRLAKLRLRSPLSGTAFFFSIAFATCIRYHGNRNGHSTSLGERQKGMTESHKQTKMSFHIVK